MVVPTEHCPQHCDGNGDRVSKVHFRRLSASDLSRPRQLLRAAHATRDPYTLYSSRAQSALLVDPNTTTFM